MIRMVQSRSATQAKEYFNESLQRSDYYVNGQEHPGRFQGKIAARLGVAGPATKAIFQTLAENVHPLTGHSLTLRTVANRTVGYDINFHCPKSVSILQALTDDTHIQDAFQQSVDQTMQDIEADAQTRVRKLNQDEDRTTGALIWADFLHQTARPVDGTVPDPHLHSHCFVFNVTWDAVEQQFKAGQFRDIKRDMPYYQARFHKILSDRLIALGYRIRRTPTAFEVVGVPKHVIDLFSKRTDEIGRIAKELGLTSASELDGLGARTRAKKQKGLRMDQLKAEWRQQILALGMRDKDEGDQPIRFAPITPPPAPSPAQCVEYALSMRFERASVMHDRRILETAYRQAIGHPATTVTHITDSFTGDKRIIRVTDSGKTLCTTKAVLAEEKHMVTLAQTGQGQLQPLYTAAPPIDLEGDQFEAVRHILTTANRVSIIRGRAGTGKTTLMKEAVRLIKATGSHVTMVAPTAQAARGVLKEEGFADAETVAKLLTASPLQDALTNGVLWVDEAGLLNTRDMTALLKLATDQNARLVLSGDTRQHTSVLRGDALRILNTVAGIPSAEVSRIFRQRDPVYRQAVQALADGKASEAFTLLDQMGAIKPIHPLDPCAELAADYVAAFTKGKRALVISPTHKEGNRTTQAIRKRLRELGRIGEIDTPVAQLVNTNLTAAEKSDGRNVKIGQMIQLNQHAPGLPRGSRWQVSSVTETQVEVMDTSGTVRQLPLSDNPPFDVFNPTTLDLAIGDAIRITRNGFDAKGRRVNNGQMLEVLAIQPDGTVDLLNRISKARYRLPSDFGHLAHAHCITSHAAQGKTVDAVFIAQPASTFGATNLNQFYVSVSRAKESVHLYTDDKDALLAQASISGERVSALELVKRRKAARKVAEQVMRHHQPVANRPTPQPELAARPITPTTLRKKPKHAPRP
ncbi:MobF family relaxase [Spirosoma sp. 209]|uniref:MobF family relaxase n=1 Tax=Spirosoma sp. 209 TaxID=1955701 RepID=UPI001F1EE664|nr:MobF family relaxase [Spirosoma sp. 209]